MVKGMSVIWVLNAEQMGSRCVRSSSRGGSHVSIKSCTVLWKSMVPLKSLASVCQSNIVLVECNLCLLQMSYKTGLSLHMSLEVTDYAGLLKLQYDRKGSEHWSASN
jgi:hypothetical protein